MSRVRQGQRGFTLIELMAVVAIIGVLATVAVSADSEDQSNADGFAEQLVSDLDQVRLRAMSSRKWQRVTFEATGAVVDEATTTGMTAPSAYETVGKITAPRRIVVESLLDAAQADGTGESAGAGNGFEHTVEFAPDGTSVGRTIFLTDVRNVSKARVVVFGATGMARAYGGW